MPRVFKDPRLPDYFAEREVENIITDYEAAKVLTFPNFKPVIDHDFWATLPADEYPVLKKLKAKNAGGDDPAAEAYLTLLPPGLAADLRHHIQAIYDQVLPAYETMFSGYVFTERRTVWRLNTIFNEKIHLDVGQDQHFARLFINLDNQPRIWNTSWRLEDLVDRWGGGASSMEIRKRHTSRAFGPHSDWWSDAPQHLTYFDPGDVWAVDSRQVSHQIFYGRRALSVDFFVDPKSMRDPRRSAEGIIAAGSVLEPAS